MKGYDVITINNRLIESGRIKGDDGKIHRVYQLGKYNLNYYLNDELFYTKENYKYRWTRVPDIYDLRRIISADKILKKENLTLTNLEFSNLNEQHFQQKIVNLLDTEMDTISNDWFIYSGTQEIKNYLTLEVKKSAKFTKVETEVKFSITNKTNYDMTVFIKPFCNRTSIPELDTFNLCKLNEPSNIWLINKNSEGEVTLTTSQVTLRPKEKCEFSITIYHITNQYPLSSPIKYGIENIDISFVKDILINKDLNLKMYCKKMCTLKFFNDDNLIDTYYVDSGTKLRDNDYTKLPDILRMKSINDYYMDNHWRTGLLESALTLDTVINDDMNFYVHYCKYMSIHYYYNGTFIETKDKLRQGLYFTKKDEPIIRVNLNPGATLGWSYDRYDDVGLPITQLIIGDKDKDTLYSTFIDKLIPNQDITTLPSVASIYWKRVLSKDSNGLEIISDITKDNSENYPYLFSKVGDNDEIAAHDQLLLTKTTGFTVNNSFRKRPIKVKFNSLHTTTLDSDGYYDFEENLNEDNYTMLKVNVYENDSLISTIDLAEMIRSDNINHPEHFKLLAYNKEFEIPGRVSYRFEIERTFLIFQYNSKKLQDVNFFVNSIELQSR